MSGHEVHFTNLVDWLDNRLDAETRQRVEKHLAGCPACQRDLAWLQRVIHAARSDDTIEPPTEAVAQVKALYRTKTKPLAPARASRVWPTAHMPHLAFAFALTFVLLVSTVLYLTQTPTLFAREATLITTVGSAQTRRMGEAEWQAVGPGEALREGDGVRVVDGTAVLTLFDGSLLEMQGGSELTFSALRSGLFGSTYQIVLQQTAGSVDYNVAELCSSRCLFEVLAPTARVAVRGTRFVITVQNQEQTHVTVLQGSVQVVSPLTTTILAEREAAIVPAHALPVYLPTLTPLPTLEPSATTTPSPHPSLTARKWLPFVTPTPIPTEPQAARPQQPTAPRPSETAPHRPSEMPTFTATASITPTSTSLASNQLHFRGTIESFPRNLLGLWTISGQSILVTPRTQITGTPAVGRQVRGIALALDRRPLMALQMEIEEPQPGLTPWLGPHPTHTPMPLWTPEPGQFPSPTRTVRPRRTLLPTITIPPRRTPILTPILPITPVPQPTVSLEATATPAAVDLAEATPTPVPTMYQSVHPRAGR